MSMHHYRGSPVSLYYFTEDEKGSSEGPKEAKGSLKLKKITLGAGGPEKGQLFHAVITKNTWFARILEKEETDSTGSDEQTGNAVTINKFNASPNLLFIVTY